MKALPKKRLPLPLFAIAVTSLFFVQPAQAFTVTLEQVGANVEGTGSGAFNLTGLTFLANGIYVGIGFTPSIGLLHIGAPQTGNADFYTGITGPTSFGTGGAFTTNISSGNFAGIDGPLGRLFVPTGYVSGNALSDSMTFNNATFASLGLTPGTYVWSWGDGANQRFTLRIGAAGVPDTGSTVSLLGCALLGLAAVRRRLGC
jgi:hypothetical protein